MSKISALLCTLALVAPAMGKDRESVLLHPMRVQGDRAQGVGASTPVEFPDGFLPCTLQVSVRARNEQDASTVLAPRFDEALAVEGLVPLQGGDWSLLRDLPGIDRVRGNRIYRCRDEHTMETLRQQLQFVNRTQIAQGTIRQIIVAVAPVPNSPYRGSNGDVWNDEIGIRVYVVGRGDVLQGDANLPFDAMPLMNSLVNRLKYMVRG